MRWLRGIAARLAFISALVALVAIVVSSAIVWRTTATDLRDRARGAALDRMEVAADGYAQTGQPIVGSAINDPNLPPVLLRAARTDRRTTFADGTRMWAVQRIDENDVLSVVQSMEADRRLLDNLLRRFALAGGIAVLVALAMGVLVASRLVRRMRRIGRVAALAADGSLQARVGDPGTDEVGDLARAVDRMTGDLGGMLERERRFSANVAHELRTPVAALVSASEVLDDPRGVRLVRDQVQRLRALVEDLLETFRADAGAAEVHCVPVILGDAVRQAVAAAGEDVGLTVPQAGCEVSLDPRRLERVLANLIANARRHGAPPVHVAVSGASVSVSDAGPGYPEWLLREGPQRFRTDAPARGGGVGLGLTIAAHQATLMGARIVFTNPPEGGARCTVTFRTPTDTEP